MKLKILTMLILFLRCPVAWGAEHVTGTIRYLQSVNLPPTVEVDVQIVEIPHAKTAPVVIAQQVIQTPHGIPILFDVPYDSQKINMQNTYVILATIKLGDRILFTTTRQYPVITHGHLNKANLVLTQVLGQNPKLD